MHTPIVNDKARNIFFLLCLFALGAFLRLNNLAERSLWTDEFFTLFQSSGHAVDIKNLLDPLSGQHAPALFKARDFKTFLKNDSSKNIQDVTRGLLYTDTHPPLYFWLMHIWMKVCGDGVWAIRLFSVLAGLACILLAYLVGVYLFNKEIARFCALFVSVSPFAVRYSQEARSYALIMALGLLSCFFILRFEKYNKKADIFYFAIVNTLGIYTHYFYAFVALAQFIYFTFAHRRDDAKLKKFYLAFLGSLLLISGWAIPVLLEGYNFRNIEWIFGFPGILNKIGYLCTGVTRFLLIFDKPVMLQSFLLVTGISCFIYIIFRSVKDGAKEYPRAFFFSLSMFLVPISGMFLIDLAQHGALLMQERFWVFSFLGFIPFAGYFLARGLSKSKPITIILLGLILASSFTINKVQFGPAPKYTSGWINKESGHKNSAVIVYNIRSAVLAQSYYLDDEIYLIPVSDNRQLEKSIEVLSLYAEKIFIARHYHRSDSSLMDQPFMAVRDIGPKFKLEKEIQKDDISVSEYIKCAL
ncbi:MAG: glycosyltransferase family 39 protein [Candidatus Omnitrophica bacterium]|nr:glycosyltransferase family 39 protein [Candidatus Omnitrophota bacterium]